MISQDAPQPPEAGPGAGRPGTAGPDGRARARALPVSLGIAWRAGPVLLLAQIAATVLTGAAPVVIAWLTKMLIDTLVTGSGPSLPLLVALLATAGGALALLPHAVQYVRAEHERRILRHTNAELFTAVCRLTGLARLEDPRFHDRLRLAQQASQSAPQIVSDAGFGVLRSAVTIAGFVAVLAAISPLATAVVVLCAVPELVVQLRLSRHRTSMMWAITPSQRRQVFYQTLLTEQQAAKEIRLLGIGAFLRDRMLGELAVAQRAERRLDLRVLRANGTLSVLSALAAGAALAAIVAQIAAGQAGIGDLAVLTAAVTGVQSSMSSVVLLLAQLSEALIMVGHYVHIVTAGPDLAEPAEGAPVPLRRGIELRDVWFRYDDSHPWVLRGVNLTIPYGGSVALVGANAAGKSTIVKLLCRLYDPQRGSVLWDGTDLRDLRTEDLRRRIGALFQDFMCYDLTAAENIGLGDLDALAEPDRLQAAARWGDVHDVLLGLPRGYDTMLSRNFASGPEEDGAGVMLSGGQWQRVALARAVLRADAADLLILDEPNSGLDPDAEHAIHERLRRYREGRSTLLISHRLNTVRTADHIVVLADGQIVEEGRHEELMALGGEYSRMFRRQAEGFQLEHT
ncbi:MAG TPA: ABC transporter ATP-binding protein [Nonomuraea sp.]|nr:ABC transporter ATP-binding protein [Nonomuraea sp.]